MRTIRTALAAPTQRYHTARTPLTGVLPVGLPDPFVVQTGAERQVLMNILMWSKGVVTVDTEATGVDITKDHPRYHERATSVQFTTDEFPRIYLDNYGENEGSIQIIKPWVQDAEKLKDGHNIKFEGHVFANHGMTLRGIDADSLVMDYLLDTSRQGRHDLETAAYDWKVTPTCLPSYRDTFSYFPLTKKGVPSKKAILKPHNEWWDDVPDGWDASQFHPNKAKVVNYGCKDTVVTKMLRKHHEAALRRIPWGAGKTYWDYYRMIELPFTSVLLRMELRGLPLDVAHLERLHEKFSKEIQEHGREFYKRLSGVGVPSSFLEGEGGKEGFNVKSTKQLAELLYGRLEYDIPKYTDNTTDGSKGGDPSTDEEALLNVQQQMWKRADDTGVPRNQLDILEPLLGTPVPGLDPIPGKRELEKLDNTYCVGLIDKAARYKGCVHTNLGQCSTATMRLNSAKPNLQNIPTRSVIGKEIRKAFIASLGCSLLVADYSQIELRVAAHKSRDATMVRYFLEGKDPHALTAYSLFPEIRFDVDARFGTVDSKEAQKYIKQNYDSHRARSKTWNFMVLYGGGESRAMSVFAVTKAEAIEKINLFFQTYPGIRGMLDRAYRHVADHGHVRSIVGRYMQIEGARSSQFGRRKAAERQAGNYEIQGSAGDIVKMGMILVDQDPLLEREGFLLRLQIHDELIGTQPIGTEAVVGPRVTDLMENSYKHFGFKSLIVPTPVELGFGANWAVAKH